MSEAKTTNADCRSNTRGAGRIGLVVLLTLAAVVGGWIVATRNAQRAEVATGGGRLIAYEALPADGEEGCEWPADVALAAAPDSARFPGEEPGPDPSGKKPVRMIRDAYASYSSVAVDGVNDEVVLTDENLFNVLVYKRLENSRGGAVSDPKRTIGGLKTKIEFQSGLYLDPKNGDIYAVNNDTVDRLVIFSRQANGDVRPDRQIHTPHGTFAMVLDEEHQEMLLTVQHDSAVVTFAKSAKTEDAPVRLLQGERTLLADPHGIALDAKDDIIFVVNHGSVHQVRPGPPSFERTWAGSQGKANWPLGFGHTIPGSGRNLPPSITVYARGASGDVAPLRVIQGPKTEMNWPTGIAFDARANEIYVANDMGDSILVFPVAANGDVAPVRVMKGTKTLLKNPTGVFVDTKNNELWVANFGNHTAAAYRLGAEGDVAPLRVIRSAPPDKPTLSIGNPHPVAYDGKREQILVPN
jgi:DNA-binding beta-propeller fold protein YncE